MQGNEYPAALLSVRDLCVETTTSDQRAQILHSVSFDLFSGETLCIVGESGSGKSVTAYSIMNLLPAGSLRILSGSIMFGERDLTKCANLEIRKLRADTISMVFQEPMTALNPVMRIGRQIDEVICTHRDITPAERKRLILEMLGEVDLPDPERIYRSYPHELSGGQRQRIVIAIALILGPKILIADEPTTALDVTTQNQVLELMGKLKRKFGTSIIFITHDFGVVAEVADRILVMKDGRVVEEGSRDFILSSPEKEYTRQLISSVPTAVPRVNDSAKDDRLIEVKGLTKIYDRHSLFGDSSSVVALDHVDLDVHKDEVVAIVGESGSGKSTLARCLIGLIDGWRGTVLLDGEALEKSIRRRSNATRKRVQIIFQDPYRSLNPRRRVGSSLTQGLVNSGLSHSESKDRVTKVLEVVGLERSVLDRYPHQFSGGQRQRLCIARAIVMEPDILIADEATSALDVTVQKQVLDLLIDLRKRTHLSILFITHDLRVAGQISDRIVVMQNGRIVEQGSASAVVMDPVESYTRELVRSAPGLHWDFANFREVVNDG